MDMNIRALFAEVLGKETGFRRAWVVQCTCAVNHLVFWGRCLLFPELSRWHLEQDYLRNYRKDDVAVAFLAMVPLKRALFTNA